MSWSWMPAIVKAQTILETDKEPLRPLLYDYAGTPLVPAPSEPIGFKPGPGPEPEPERSEPKEKP